MVSAVAIVVDVVDQRCCDIIQRRSSCDRPIIIGIVIVIVTQIICVPDGWNGEGRQAPRERVYSDPTREKSKSAAELAVKALELRMKGIMLESSLPVTFWKLAYDEAIEISNMYPITKNITSRDGDAIRPLEEISNGRVSRQFINKMLKYFVLLGTPARISTNKIKGSDVQNSARERWGIAWGRVNDVPLWLDPFQPGVTFRSKDYIIHQLKPHAIMPVMLPPPPLCRNLC
eukprot:COSAG01_NODE_665_length_14398_cov_91.714595_4_plen_231_part_00